MGEGLVGLPPLIIVLLIGSGIIWWIFKSRKNETIVTDENGDQVRSGLGGWLILVGIGIVLSPLRLLSELGQIYGPMFNDGTYEYVTTPGTDAYHSFWTPYIWGGLIGNCVVLLVSIYAIFLFFNKKSLFPKLYIWVVCGSLVFVLIEASLVRVVMPDEPIFDPETLQSILQQVVGIVIWVPYMLLSKRVKVTFVH